MKARQADTARMELVTELQAAAARGDAVEVERRLELLKAECGAQAYASIAEPVLLMLCDAVRADEGQLDTLKGMLGRDVHPSARQSNTRAVMCVTASACC